MRQEEAYLVAIATYQRPVPLKGMLDSLVPAVAGRNVEVLVIDNDPDATAREVALGHPLRPRYQLEVQPGLPCARNRALDAFTEEFAGIFFVDDDGWVDPNWVGAMAEFADRTGAGVVTGAIVTVLPETAPDWLRRGGWFQRMIHPTGTPLPTAAGGNSLLMRSAWVAAGRPRFDGAFTTTGGEDTAFYTGMSRAGIPIVYCAEAILFEDVPVARASARWIFRRYVRNGIILVQVHRKYGDPLRPVLRSSVAECVLGAARLASGVIRGRGFSVPLARRIVVNLGVLAGLAGYRIRDFRVLE